MIEEKIQQQIYYRLIALWVLCESMIGGIIHGFKLPFSGLIAGSSAIVCICLIAWHVPQRGAILKATIIVAIFKLTLSPQAPPTAYIAVFFQGFMGQALLSPSNNFKFRCMVFGMIALFESAIQRLLVLTLIYGTEFWKAFNDFINKITGEKTFTNYSLGIVIGYLLFHIIFGNFVGAFAANIIRKSAGWQKGNEDILIESGENSFRKNVEEVKKRSKLKSISFVIWIILIAFYIQSTFHIGKPLLPAHISIKILLRSALIILTWYFLISPLLLKIIKNKLLSQQKKSSADIEQVMLLLPSIKNILSRSWQISASAKGFTRMRFWAKIVLTNILR